MTTRLGAREWVEIDADILAGERPAAAIAESYEVSERTITRRRAELRKKGLKLRVDIEPDYPPERLRQMARTARAVHRQHGRWAR